MNGMKEIHNNVFKLLKSEHEKNLDLMFTMRKTNRQNRLENGYWFLGNDKYMSVSFWSGMDWKNKTSNLYFQVNDDKSCHFIITAKDSRFKLKFTREKVVSFLVTKQYELDIKLTYERNDVFIFHLGSGDYIEILKKFLVEIKPEIDRLIDENENNYEGILQYAHEHYLTYGTEWEFTERDDQHSPIIFLNQFDFYECLNRINGYILKNSHYYEKNESEFYLKKIEISNVGDIRKMLTIEIPKESSWVFLTGENGCGKTTILRAITSKFNEENIPSYPILKSDSLIKLYPHSTKPNDAPIAFAAYGPSRLISTSIKSFSNDNSYLEKTKPWYSIFHSDGILLGFEELRKKYSLNDYQNLKSIISFLEDMFNQKDDNIENIEPNDLSQELIPQIAEVNFDNFITKGEILYREKDNENIPYEKCLPFEDLASGVKSLLALIADLLIKLIERNRNEPDPANFRAVVLIDEIDIHFHPSMQKKVVEILSENFPKVQFIVTTHSPVTLLGAPKNSIIYVVKRSVEEGVTARRIDDKMYIQDLLPNTILTSPIFGLDNITNINRNKYSNTLRTEKTFSELEFNDKVKDRINNFIDDKIEKELITLFENRRK